jgi:hypothetical protein
MIKGKHVVRCHKKDQSAYAMYVKKVKSPDLVLGIGNIDKKTHFM